MKKILSILLIISSCAVAHDLIGYLPNYRINPKTLKSINHCTDVVFFGPELAENGKIKLPENADKQLTQISQAIQKQNKSIKTRLILCVGGWDKDKFFPTVSSSPEKRQRFATSLQTLTKKYRLSGIDLDWEYPRNDQQWQDLGKMITTGKRTLKTSGSQSFIWSTAVHPNHTIPNKVVKLLDRIHLMTYDAGKQHCDPTIATKAAEIWQARGVPTNKLCIGAAFYGRKINQRNTVKTYAEIHRSFGEAAVTTQTAGGFYYDNPASCKAKRTLVKDQNLRGIIVWELGQDAPGKHSLLPHLK